MTAVVCVVCSAVGACRMQCCSVLCRFVCSVCESVCCTDPTVLVCGNGHWFSCPTAAPCGPFGAQPSASGYLIASRQAHFSPITRLPSGSSISHSAHFRDPALSVGVGTAHGCTRRFLRSARAQRAAPCGHIASLVRSASPARLPSASLRRIYLRLHVRLKMHHPLADAGCPA